MANTKASGSHPPPSFSPSSFSYPDAYTLVLASALHSRPLFISPSETSSNGDTSHQQICSSENKLMHPFPSLIIIDFGVDCCSSECKFGSANRITGFQVAERDCPHLLFYGPPGSGKKTLIIALIRQIFGPSVDKVKVENKTRKVDAGSSTIDIELTTLSSNNHFELNPSDAGFQDRYIVQEIIKEIANVS
ncbi:hypothetical protein ACLB2K_013553 [Fragaria x ananassa]